MQKWTPLIVPFSQSTRLPPRNCRVFLLFNVVWYTQGRLLGRRARHGGDNADNSKPSHKRGDVLELPKRKNTRLKDYNCSSGGAYSIAICVKDRHPLLGEIVGGQMKSFTTMKWNEICGTHMQAFWQRGYHDHRIQNEEDYLRIGQYIDKNPAKWAEDRYFSKKR